MKGLIEKLENLIDGEIFLREMAGCEINPHDLSLKIIGLFVEFLEDNLCSK